MGLFGNKISKEEKAFNKALKAAIGSHREKNLKELLSATEAYPAPWQGYWLASLYYDMGLGKVAVDENKAKDYQYKAENAAKGTEDEDWVDSFYYWYNQNAGNRIRKMKDISLKYRKLGIAALNVYEHGKSYIIKDELDDAYTWAKLFPLFGDNEGANFKYLFDDWAGFEYRQRNDFIKSTNEFVKRAKSGLKSYKLDMKVNASRPEKLTYDDMSSYLIGTCFLVGSPYALDEVAEASGKNNVYIGTEYLLYAAAMGNIPALYDLIRYAHSDDRSNYGYISEICQEVMEESLAVKEIDWMLPLVDAGEPEAVRLNQLYGILGDA